MPRSSNKFKLVTTESDATFKCNNCVYEAKSMTGFRLHMKHAHQAKPKLWNQHKLM